MRFLAGLLLVLAPLSAWAWWRQSQGVPVSPLDPAIWGPLENAGTVPAPLVTAPLDATRGERNNNPGNLIKTGIGWLGKVIGTDSTFEVFDTSAAGLRALSLQLRSYIRRGKNTVRKIITAYAPPSENNTDAYVQDVARRIGRSPDGMLSIDDATIAALVEAIVFQENGRVIYSRADIQSAVRLA